MSEAPLLLQVDAPGRSEVREIKALRIELQGPLSGGKGGPRVGSVNDGGAAAHGPSAEASTRLTRLHRAARRAREVCLARGQGATGE